MMYFIITLVYRITIFFTVLLLYTIQLFFNIQKNKKIIIKMVKQPTNS